MVLVCVNHLQMIPALRRASDEGHRPDTEHDRRYAVNGGHQPAKVSRPGRSGHRRVCDVGVHVRQPHRHARRCARPPDRGRQRAGPLFTTGAPQRHRPAALGQCAELGHRGLLARLVLPGRGRGEGADRCGRGRRRLRRAVRGSDRQHRLRAAPRVAVGRRDNPGKPRRARPTAGPLPDRGRAAQSQGGQRRTRAGLRPARLILHLSQATTPSGEKTAMAKARWTQVGELRHGVLGSADAIAQSLALLALTFAVSAAPASAAVSAGAAVPAAYVIAGIGSLCLASVIVRFTRRIAHAGGLYAYTVRGLGPQAGFIGGWMYAIAFAIGISFVLIISADFLSAVLTANTSIHLGWFPLYLILLALILLIVLTVIGVLTIVVLSLIIVAKGGAHGLTWRPFDLNLAPSTHGLFLAVILAFTGYIGFEAAAVLGEEAAEPRRVIPR